MAERKTSWSDTNRLNLFRPKYGQISSDRKHWWNGKKWVINNPREIVKPEESDKYFGVGNYGSGGPKESERSKDNNTNNKNNTTPKKGPVVKSVGTIDFNINTKAGLTSYNKALKASQNKKTDKEKDKASNVALKEERNRNKLSSKDFKKTSLSNNKSNKKSNNFTSTVHTRHYKTGERLGVMTLNQRRAYEKAAMGKDGKLRTFEGEVAKHEKESGHGKSHLRETLYRSNVRKTDREARKTKREGLKMGRTEKTAGSPKHKPGGELSQYNTDGSLKSKTNNNNNQEKKKKRKWWEVPVSVRPVL